MLDFGQLLPHCKKDAKLDTKTDRMVINEVADMKVGPLVCFDGLPAVCWLMLSASYWSDTVPTSPPLRCIKLPHLRCRAVQAWYSLRHASGKTCISGLLKHQRAHPSSSTLRMVRAGLALLP